MVAGLRPDDIVPVGHGMPPAREVAVEGVVILSEMLGGESQILLRLGSSEAIAKMAQPRAGRGRRATAAVAERRQASPLRRRDRPLATRRHGAVADEGKGTKQEEIDDSTAQWLTARGGWREWSLGVGTAVRADDVPLYHDKGFWAQQFQAVGDAAKEKTGVRIVQTSYAPPNNTRPSFSPRSRRAHRPDLFTWWTGATFKELVATGKIAPLDDVWEQMIASGQYEKATQDLFKVDGKTYAVPLSVSRWVVLYNKKMFADSGLAEPKTWDDLMAAADKLKAAGITPFEATVQEGWRGFIWFEELMIRTNPDAYMGLHDGSVPYDGPAVQKAFQLWSDMYAKGYFTDPRSNEEAQDFARGKAAMYLIGRVGEGLVENGRPEGRQRLRRLHHAERRPEAAIIGHRRSRRRSWSRPRVRKRRTS